MHYSIAIAPRLSSHETTAGTALIYDDCEAGHSALEARPDLDKSESVTLRKHAQV